MVNTNRLRNVVTSSYIRSWTLDLVSAAQGMLTLSHCEQKMEDLINEYTGNGLKIECCYLE